MARRIRTPVNNKLINAYKRENSLRLERMQMRAGRMAHTKTTFKGMNYAEVQALFKNAAQIAMLKGEKAKAEKLMSYAKDPKKVNKVAGNIYKIANKKLGYGFDKQAGRVAVTGTGGSIIANSPEVFGGMLAVDVFALTPHMERHQKIGVIGDQIKYQREKIRELKSKQ